MTGIENGMIFGTHRAAPPDGSGDACAAAQCNAAYDRADHEDVCGECGQRFCPECALDMTRAEGYYSRVCASCAAKLETGERE